MILTVLDEGKTHSQDEHCLPAAGFHNYLLTKAMDSGCGDASEEDICGGTSEKVQGVSLVSRQLSSIPSHHSCLHVPVFSFSVDEG